MWKIQFIINIKKMLTSTINKIVSRLHNRRLLMVKIISFAFKTPLRLLLTLMNFYGCSILIYRNKLFKSIDRPCLMKLVWHSQLISNFIYVDYFIMDNLYSMYLKAIKR